MAANEPTSTEINVAVFITDGSAYIQHTTATITGPGRLRVRCQFPEQISQKAVLRQIADAFTTNGFNWLRPVDLPDGKWVIDLDQLPIDIERSREFQWLTGRYLIEPQYNFKVTFSSNPIQQATTIEWCHPPIENEDDLMPCHPADLKVFLENFTLDHADPRKCGFVIMQFHESKKHKEIVDAIVATCDTFGIKAIRSDHKNYAEELFPNVRTYMHGCAFGIAVFERILKDDCNPNVSLEVGYMLALEKPVCLLKDKTLPHLPTDLVGRLYEQFDIDNVGSSIQAVLTKWLQKKGLA